MIERFEGEDGKRLLPETFADQGIVNGDKKIAAGLLEVAQLRELKAGDVLITQDAEDNDIFLVISGILTVYANGRPYATRKAGTHVGEMALIDRKARRSATVLAAEKTVVAQVTEPAFSRLADANPELWRRSAVELCDRLRNRNRLIRRPNEVPNVFIYSSSENLVFAEGIQLGLDHHCSSVSVWTDQAFGPTKQTMEDLERELQMADFGIAVVMDEDVVRSRKEQKSAPRDNVVFELGLFMGQLGRERTVLVSPRNINLKMPSDLLGLNPLAFSQPSDPTDQRQLATALAPVCTQLKSLFDRIGPR
ncbi:MAG: nucleotide-binding protein [Planctomycetaceae bacterium]|nr:nucleotide-binding protein [Planctomycetaceae bacterium]